MITFNYDILLERALEAANIPYRLFPDRFESVTKFYATVDPREESEVVLLKMHGSIDWFDKRRYIERREDAREQEYPSSVPSDPLFNFSDLYTVSRLVEGARLPEDPLREMYRLKEIERFYASPPWFMSTPAILNPSTMKLIYSGKFGQFWYGMNRFGASNLRLVLIGYSLPPHDDYARQAIYRIVRNYQWIAPERVLPYAAEKEPLIIVDYKKSKEEVAEFRERYSFVDWDRAELFHGGFNAQVLERL